MGEMWIMSKRKKVGYKELREALSSGKYKKEAARIKVVDKKGKACHCFIGVLAELVGVEFVFNETFDNNKKTAYLPRGFYRNSEDEAALFFEKNVKGVLSKLDMFDVTDIISINDEVNKKGRSFKKVIKTLDEKVLKYVN